MNRAVRMVLPSAVVLVACGSGEAPAVRAVVRDSAGISIVENTAPLAPDSSAFLVDSVPALEIGGSDDPHAEFGRVAGLLRLPDGGIAVADGGNNELRLFDSTGAWLRTAGGKGGGPGEFEQLGGLFRLGADSLATYDWDHRRISVFSARGDLVREMTLPQGGMDAGFPHVFGVLADGEFLVRQERYSGESGTSGLKRDSIAVFRYTREAVLADSIGRFPGSESYQEVESSGGRIRGVLSMGLPFGLTLTLLAAGDRFYVATGERYEIGQYDRTGRLIRLIRRTHAPAAVTAADIATMREQRFGRFRPGMEAVRDRVKGLWVRRYDQPAVDQPARYDVFDRDGQWQGHVTFAPRFTLYHAGPRHALGVWQDPDEVEYLRLYRLHPTP